MNGFDLTASLFSSLVSLGWPIALVLSAYLFRERLNEILPRLQVRHKDTEISFQIEAAKEQAESLPAPKDSSTQQPEQKKTTQVFASQSPDASILWTWVQLEQKIRLAARVGYQLETDNRRSVTRIVEELHSIGAISTDALELFMSLRDIRNRVAHPTLDQHRVDTDDALSYAELASRVSAAIDDMPSWREIAAA